MSRQIPPWSMAVVAMLSVQLGAAVSIGMFDDVGVAGTAWLRLTIAAVVLVAVVRPHLRRYRARDLRAAAVLGVVSGVMTLSFLAAISLLPLGTAVAIEFLGPLTVAALHAKGRRALAWPALALVGVVLLTEPWRGSPSLVGIGFAVLSGIGWGLYIVITQTVGDRFVGVEGLAVSLPVAAAVTAVFGVPQAWGRLSVDVLTVALVAAILLPLVPWVLELLALRGLTKSAFGTLMALEPAIALTIGGIALAQRPGVGQVIGIGCVVMAGVAAERTGRRHSLPELETPVA